MGLLNHQQLMLIKGFGATPTDTTSAENAPLIVDFLTPNSAFSLVDWSPNIPSVKNGGVWADSAINDGRDLVVAVNTNVIETMVIHLNGASCQAFAAEFALLRRIIEHAKAFHDSFWQYDPVFIQWWATGAPGSQAALIYSADMKVTYQDSNNTQAEIVLTIEREPGWRALPPGANPRQWAFYFRGTGSQWNSSVANLSTITTGLDLISNLTLFNHLQLSANGATVDKQNWIDIPAASIPGDLSALALICFDPDDSIGKVYVSRDTLNKVNTNLAATHQNQKYDLAAAWAILGTDTTSVADTGGIVYNGAAAARGQISFATVATDTMRLEWGLIWVHTHTRFAAFARMRQNGGTFGDIKTSLKVFGSNTSIFITTTEVSPTLQAGAGNTTDWPVTYMGVIQLPISDLYSDDAGKGLSQTLASSIDFMARRTAGAGVLYVADVILVPISEAAMCMINNANSNGKLFLDTTGYFSHGRSGLYTPISQPELELRGESITLLPGVDNRLYFFTTTITDTSQVGYGADVAINIIPRWSGIRDR